MKIVLERSSGEQEAIATVELPETLANLTVFIFELVRFVHDHVLPFKLEELVHAGAHAFKCCETYVELAWLQMVLE